MADLLPVKPLFSLLVKAFLQFGELSMIITSQVYSLVYGPEVIRLLGSSEVFDTVQAFQDRKTTLKVVATFLLVNQAVFLVSYSLQLGTQWAWPPTLDSATANLVLYSVGANNFFYFHLLLYLQYGTSVVLKNLRNEVLEEAKKAGNSYLDSVTGQLRSLALVHDRLLSLIAFPFSYLVMMSFLSTVNCACLLTMFYSAGDPWQLMLFFYPAIIWGYFVLLVVLNRRNLAAFDFLVKQLVVKQKKENSRLQKGSLFGNRSLSVFDLQEQYRRCFQLRLFHLVSVDLAFAFAATLLALNFIVFLVQTK